jgi:hypothetical protein
MVMCQSKTRRKLNYETRGKRCKLQVTVLVLAIRAEVAKLLNKRIIIFSPSRTSLFLFWQFVLRWQNYLTKASEFVYTFTHVTVLVLAMLTEVAKLLYKWIRIFFSLHDDVKKVTRHTSHLHLTNLLIPHQNVILPTATSGD